MNWFDKIVAWVSKKQEEYREIQGYSPKDRMLRTPESFNDCKEKIPGMPIPPFTLSANAEILKYADLSKCKSVLPDQPGGVLPITENEDLKQEPPIPELINCPYCGTSPKPEEEVPTRLDNINLPKICIYTCSNDFCDYQPHTQGHVSFFSAAHYWNNQDVEFAKADRKAIQVFDHRFNTYALCDDGTMWVFDNEDWKQVKSPPRRKFKIDKGIG